jgi:hypothetical protein
MASPRPAFIGRHGAENWLKTQRTALPSPISTTPGYSPAESRKFINHQCSLMLIAMAALLALAFWLHAYDPPRPTTEAQQTEPVHSRFEWHTSDYLND